MYIRIHDRRVHEANSIEHLRVARTNGKPRLAEMNQVQDVATVFVPRLKLTVTLVLVQQAITQSVKELGYNQPTDDQAEALQKFVSGRDVFISLPIGSGAAKLELIGILLCARDRHSKIT